MKAKTRVPGLSRERAPSFAFPASFATAWTVGVRANAAPGHAPSKAPLAHRGSSCSLPPLLAFCVERGIDGCSLASQLQHGPLSCEDKDIPFIRSPTFWLSHTKSPTARLCPAGVGQRRQRRRRRSAGNDVVVSCIALARSCSVDPDANAPLRSIVLPPRLRLQPKCARARAIKATRAIHMVPQSADAPAHHGPRSIPTTNRTGGGSQDRALARPRSVCVRVYITAEGPSSAVERGRPTHTRAASSKQQSHIPTYIKPPQWQSSPEPWQEHRAAAAAAAGGGGHHHGAAARRA